MEKSRMPNWTMATEFAAQQAYKGLWVVLNFFRFNGEECIEVEVESV